MLDMTTAKNGETIDDMKKMLSYADYFLPNEEELKSISGGLTTDEAARKILSFGVKAVVVKRGGKDTLLYTDNDRVEVPIYKTANVIDTTGAGDSFGAGFIYGLHKKMSLKECVTFGNAVASCAVEFLGATTGVQDLDKLRKRFQDIV